MKLRVTDIFELLRPIFKIGGIFVKIFLHSQRCSTFDLLGSLSSDLTGFPAFQYIQSQTRQLSSETQFFFNFIVDSRQLTLFKTPQSDQYLSVRPLTKKAFDLYERTVIQVNFSRQKSYETNLNRCSLCFQVLAMSKPFGVFCCLVFLALISSSTSYNPFEKFGVYCKPETYTRPVTKSGCGSQKVRVKACLGTCASYAQPLDHSPHFKKVCECCKPSSTQMVTFNLPDCRSGISPIVQVESAVQCKCKMCT